jgi:hypothetical protein
MSKNPKRRLLAVVPFVFLANLACAYGIYDNTDTYVTSQTALVRLKANGQIREIWSGMDAAGNRHQPVFWEAAIHVEVLGGDGWHDLRNLKYHQLGTRPGYIRMQSDDGTVSIEGTSRRNTSPCPIVMRYTLATPKTMRLKVAFKPEDQISETHFSDRTGYLSFSKGRSDQGRLGNDGRASRSLFLRTLPLGTTLSIGSAGAIKQFEASKQLVLRVEDSTPPFDAIGTEELAASTSIDSKANHGVDPVTFSDGAERITLVSDDPRLDRLFECSIDAIESLQFASGVVTADFCKYQNSWLRDGTYSMIALALAGDHEAVGRYFAFWNAQCDFDAVSMPAPSAAPTQQMFSVGGELEAQQPAIAITGMWYFSRLTPDSAGFLKKYWPYVRYFADYYSRRVDNEGMLNVGEEWICNIPAPSSWPNAEIYSGLRAAAKIAAEEGNAHETLVWTMAAEKLRKRFSSQAYDNGKNRIIPIAGPSGEYYSNPTRPNDVGHNGPLRDDRVDAGMLNTARLEAFGHSQGIVSADDPKFASTQDQIIKELENADHSISRLGPNPGNPHSPLGSMETWPIIICWAAQDEWLLGRTDLAWRYLLSAIVNKAGYDLAAANYYLPETWDTKGNPGDPLLVWSHGEFVTSTILLFLGIDLEPPDADIGLAPSLPLGMSHARIRNFRFRDWKLDVALTRRKNLVDVALRADSVNPRQTRLAVRLAGGQTILADSGHALKFTVAPGEYCVAFGRSANARERAGIASTFLAARNPTIDLNKMTLREQEDLIEHLETEFVPPAR